MSLDGETIGWGMPRDVYEAKVGLQLELGVSWSAWGNLGLRSAAGEYRDVSGLIGLKRSW